MYFKSLELIGFKSFAEKTKLNFEPGVTAIVGPNGCGKSNIADSIRWVLGEQSAKSLRASSMQDVIFNGTDTKEPINFAEVSLTFSNEKRILPIDYDEVTITRRVFRSGETEYLLNKTPVRLKDISELLMGTGIGTESYSIIEQGKIDLILSSKPEDRRYVFEEASGITKYKSKKKEALRKLEQTEQNLLRISDIIQEVKRQISSIERQARKAERYKVDFDRLKDMEVKFSFCEYKDLKSREATHTVENSDSKAMERELDLEIKSISSKISGGRQSLDGINQKISDLKNAYSEMSNSLEMNNHKIEIDNERIQEANVLQEGLKSEIGTVNEKIVNAKMLVDKLKNELKAAASERISKQKSLEGKIALLDNLSSEIEDTELKLKTCKVQTVDYLSKETQFKNELIKLGADVQNRKARERRLSIEKATVEKELGVIDRALAAVLEDFRTIEDNVLALRSKLDSKRGVNVSILSEIKNTEEDLAKEENRKAVVKSKIEILEDNLKRHEGFSRGVKSLLSKIGEGNGNFNGVLGVFADMIKVEKGYEAAVSTFLGNDAQIIITHADSDITRIVDYLKTNRLGSASFISMESLNKGKREEPAPAPAADLTPLKNFVRIDTRYEVLKDRIFENAYMTKSGCVVDGIKISGGSGVENDESLLIGRKDRLSDLKAELKKLDQNLASLNSARDKLREESGALQAEILSLDENVHKEDINLANIKMKKDNQEGLSAKLKDEIELLDSELEEMSQTIGELTKKGESINLELNNIESEKARAQSFIDESQVRISERRGQKEKTALEATALSAELASSQKDEENVRNNLKAQEAFFFEFDETLYSKECLLKESVEKARSLEEEIAKLRAENQALSIKISSLKEESSKIDSSRLAIIETLSMDDLQLKSSQGELEVLRNQTRDLDVKLTELNYKKTNLKDRIFQAYRVDLETAHVEIEEGVDWDGMKRDVLELKEKIEKMGPVNLVAIDEHKELEERHAFLVHQQEDLVNAKDSLLKAIQKINKTTKELFIDTFQKIQAEFKNFFRLLFGGGQAELVLIDEQDILESGIEIIVRPPGKKLQNLMLLSGGEKALTAIALLFSIFKVKPSPFCVLDEIDAPLDESNINRFSNVLKDFLKISQFIIITHNKRTIELADVMYGITMQERGVSKIVSVKFLDEKKKPETQVGAQTQILA